MISINIKCRKERTNSQGLASIVIRVTKSRRHAMITTGIKINPKDWNDAKSKVRSSHPNHRRINAQLSKKYSKIEEFALDLEKLNRTYNISQFRDWFLNDSNANVVVYFRNWIDTNKSNGKITHSTKIKYEGILHKLSQYVNGALPVSEFNETFCEKYHQHLISKYSNSVNTIASNMRCLRAVAHAMVRDRMIKVDDNPFIRYKIKTESSERKYLTLEEIDKIRNINQKGKIEESRLIFLFCYETGLRIGDALHLKNSDYNGSHIRYHSQKTKVYESLLLTRNAREIIEDMISKNNGKTCFVFDFLNEGLINDEGAALNNQKSCTALINKNLKLIGARAGVSRKFSTHFGRHSMATHALSKGLTYAEVKGILNHKDVKTTQHYAKVIDLMKDSAVRKLDQKQ